MRRLCSWGETARARRAGGCCAARLAPACGARQPPRPATRLHAQADGAVAHVGAARGLHGVEVDVDDLVEVARHHARHLRQLVKVKVPAAGGSAGVGRRGVGEASVRSRPFPAAAAVGTSGSAQALPPTHAPRPWPRPPGAHLPSASRLPTSFLLSRPLGSFSRTKRGSAMEARLHTAVSSADEYSMISALGAEGGAHGGAAGEAAAQRREHRTAPRAVHAAAAAGRPRRTHPCTGWRT